ncbi:hypothetical protein MFFC18_11200 [Mariniblastus fucicola]|uniref:WD40-like Beta Propeller Repeat protein n=2 Tax=Mariniblastus fucicola TaxID=980251 RepID=A0A5B9P7U3_9BACT|nr:hypothetical protein MFFC18_11200 [Mariniblastus fucicola]
MVCLILGLAFALCQSSSAQEPDNSTKVQEKAASSKKKKMVVLGRFEDQRINESSGVTVARPDDSGNASNAIWTFNDSGGSPVLFQVSTKGQTQATLEVLDAKNRDWEAMCGFSMNDQPFLAVGNVGDNQFKQKKYQLYVVAEPLFKPEFSSKGKLKEQQLKASSATIEFKYEDGSHNCEAMSYNADDDTFWFIEKVYIDDKRKTQPGIYTLANPLTAEAKAKQTKPKNIARRVADFPIRNVTGMAFSPNNKRLIVRNYFGAWLFEKGEGKTWLQTVTETKPTVLSVPLQSQGEAICFAADSEAAILTSELKGAIIWKVALDQNARKDKK